MFVDLDGFKIANNLFGHDAGDAVVLAEGILATVCRSVEVDGGTATVAASVGIALTSAQMHGETALRAADVAMYRAKREVSNRYLIDERGVRLSR